MHSELEFDAASHDTDVVNMHLENIEELLWRIIARIDAHLKLNGEKW
jgi:hypothetical protein